VSRSHRLLVLAALYFSQGLPYGFFTLALPVILRERGMSLGAVTASGWLLMPWALKFVWGPVIDGYGIDRFGRRRSWILPLQALTVLVLLGLATVDPTSELQALGLGMLLMAVLASTQDVATDGLAVDLLSEGDRGIGNGLQVGAYRFGMIVGGSAVLVLYVRAGPASAFCAMAALLALASLPVLLLREPQRPRLAGLDLRGAVAVLPLLGGAWWLSVALFKAGDAMASPMVKTLLVDAGWSVEQLASLMGLLASAAGLSGALLGGALVGRLGRNRALVLFGLLQAAALATNVGLVWFAGSAVGAASIVLLEHVVSGMATASLFAAMMDRCRPGHEASDFTLQACVVVLSSGLVGGLGGQVAERWGYAVHFGAASLLSALAVAAVLWAVRPGRRHAA
jgi:PAT family beta-lactamase induction signal transducer AmpG